MAISDSTASPIIELHQTSLKCLTTAQNVTTPVGIFFCSELLKTKFSVLNILLQILVSTCWKCWTDTAVWSADGWRVFGVWVVLNSSALVTILISSPWSRHRAVEIRTKVPKDNICKDFTITEKAPTRDFVGAFSVIVKYSRTFV